MKTKNFPGSKNQRRKVALEALLKKKNKSHSDKRDIDILKDKVMDDGVARSIRTKIAREKR